MRARWTVAAALAGCCAVLAACSEAREQAGSPAPTCDAGVAPGVHPAGIADPASDAFHGKLLRARRWAPMLDASDPEACGRCHLGAPSTSPGVTLPAPGATACTDCHTEPQGALACSTCHGAAGPEKAPRSPCFAVTPPVLDGAHRAHVEPSAASATGLACGTCHPTPGPGVIGGRHGDGVVEVTFAPALSGTYDATTGACAVACHDHGGSRPHPAWSETAPMDCNGCHTSPPAGHFPGPCSSCHQEASATGTALSGGPLHLNGHVDLGDGSGQCGACHGQGADPWPRTGAHPAHAHPTIAAPFACSSCHVVPADVLTPGHLDAPLQVTFGGHALDRGAQPGYDAGTCSQVACHGAVLTDVPAVAPVWTDTSGAASACGACHPIPPTQHTPSTSCNRVTCHGGEIDLDQAGLPSISPSGLALHINGVIDTVQ